jgi:hypothetical protein
LNSGDFFSKAKEVNIFIHFSLSTSSRFASLTRKASHFPLKGMQFALHPNGIDCSFFLADESTDISSEKSIKTCKIGSKFSRKIKEPSEWAERGRIKVEEQRRKQIFDTFVWPRDQTTATYSPVHEADLPSRPLSRCYRPVKWWGPFLVTGPRSATFRALPLASRLVTFTENTAQCVAVLLAKRGQMFFHSLLSSQP